MQLSLCKKCPYPSFSGPYFLAFGLNAERYSLSLLISAGKCCPEKLRIRKLFMQLLLIKRFSSTIKFFCNIKIFCYRCSWCFVLSFVNTNTSFFQPNWFATFEKIFLYSSIMINLSFRLFLLSSISKSAGFILN